MSIEVPDHRVGNKQQCTDKTDDADPRHILLSVAISINKNNLVY